VRDRLPLLGIVISVLSVAGVVYWASRQEAPDLPSTSGQLAALLGAIGLYAVNTAIRAERWHRLLQQEGAEPRRADSYSLTVIGYAGNNVLPARAGDAVRVVLIAPRAQTTVRAVIGTLLAERLLDIAVLVLLFVVVGYAVLGEIGSRDVELLAAITAGGLVVAAIAFLLLRRNERMMGFLMPILQSTLSLKGGHGAFMLALTAIIWGMEAAVWTEVGVAVDVDMNFLEGMYLVGLACLFSLIPSGPGYAGTQDAAVAIGVKALGESGSAAVSYIVMLRFVLVVPITAVGFLLLAVRYGGVSMLRQSRIEREAAA
jgi:glycosyltransferase 2 family protein